MADIISKGTLLPPDEFAKGGTGDSAEDIVNNPMSWAAWKREAERLAKALEASEANAANLCLEWNAAIEDAEKEAEIQRRRAESNWLQLMSARADAEMFRTKYDSLVLMHDAYRLGHSKRTERLEQILREALPQSMGGYPDLFHPPCGWEDWEERAIAILDKGI